jgi:hypothetical protein
MQDVCVHGVHKGRGALAKLVPTTPRRMDAIAQPPQGTVLVRVLKPLAGLALPPSQFKEHDGQHQIGAMRRLAAASIGAVEFG